MRWDGRVDYRKSTDIYIYRDPDLIQIISRSGDPDVIQISEVSDKEMKKKKKGGEID